MAAHRKDLDDSTIIDLYLQGKSSKIHGQL